MLRRHFLAVGAALMATTQLAWAQTAEGVPAGYPAEYADIIAESQKAPEVMVYSNLQLKNWEQVIAGFKARYPWTTVTLVDLGSEVFERYFAESGTNGRTADLIVAGGADSWLEFEQKAGAIDYKSPEIAEGAQYATLSPGIYTMATDPAIIVYNKMILPEAEAPKSVKGIAELVEKRPDLRNRVTTQSVAVPFGRTSAWAWVQHNADAWDTLAKLGPVTRPERAVGGILEKISTGEYVIGWSVNASALFQKLNDPAFTQLVGWSFAEDGTPIVPRYVSIPKNSRNQATAKMFLNYILSHEGQVAFGATGVTPFRADVKKDEVRDYSYSAIVDQIGEPMVAFDHDPQAYAAGRDAFVERWRSLFVNAQ